MSRPDRACDVCASLYRPQRVTSRYCSDRCRKRAQRSGVARPAEERAGGAAAPGASKRRGRSLGAVTAAVLAELRAANQEKTAAGQAALALAQRIDFSSSESGAAVASMTRALIAAMDAALKSSAAAEDVLDELARKRAERMASTSRG